MVLRYRSKPFLFTPFSRTRQMPFGLPSFLFFRKSFPGIAKELPAARRGSPHKRPVAYGHKPANAGRCGGYSRSLRSLKCGRNLRFPPKRPLPDRFDRFHLGFLGNGFCFPQRVSGVPYLPGI